MKKALCLMALVAFGGSLSYAQQHQSTRFNHPQTSWFAPTSYKGGDETRDAKGTHLFRSGICAISTEFSSGLPAEWTLESTNPQGTWTYGGQVGNPNGGFRILRDPDLLPQDESIVTDTFDLASLNRPALFFDWFASYYWSVFPNDNVDLLVEISVNGGNSWDSIWSEENGVEFDNYQWYSEIVDLSAYATSTDAIIRIRYVGQEGAQANIDNVSICEWADNDIKMNFIYTGDNRTDFIYSKVPLAQATEFIIGGIVENMGAELQDSLVYSWEISLDGNPVAAGIDSTIDVVASLDTHLFYVSTGYTPSMVGDYTVEISVSSNNGVEANTSDNTLDWRLEYTDYVWAHDYENLAYAPFGRGEVTEPEGFETGCRYFSRADGNITSIQFPLHTSSDCQSVSVKVYEITQSGYDLLHETFLDIMPGQESGTNPSFITAVLDDAVDIVAGQTIATTVAVTAGDSARFQGNRYTDNDNGQALYSVFEDTWYNIVDVTYPIRVNFDPTLGIAENEEVSGFSIYPNPAAGQVVIDFTAKEDNAVTINLISVEGALVLSQQLSVKAGVNSKVKFDTSNLAVGLYTVQLSGSNSAIAQKLIIQ